MKDFFVRLLKQSFLNKIRRKYYEKKRAENNEKKSVVFLKEGATVLQKFAEVLNQEGILFWIEFGTLLGYYRDHDFIKHDCDLDTGVFLKDKKRVNEALKKAGFELVRYYDVPSDGGREECYKHKDLTTTIDVFYFREDGNTMYCNLFSPVLNMYKSENLNKNVPYKVGRVNFPLDNFLSVEFKGAIVNIPENTDLHLKYQYGENYMTPNPKFGFKDRKNIIMYTYEEKPATGFLIVGF